MTFAVSKKAAISVKELFLRGPGIGDLPLQSVTMTMGIDTPCICACVPVVGRDRLNGRKADPDKIEKIDPMGKYSLYLNIRNQGGIGGNKSRLFVGRPMGTGMNVTMNPLGSTIGTTITLQHITQSDLGAVAIGQRSYYRWLNTTADFRMNPYSNSTNGAVRFTNDNLLQGVIAVYLKQLCIELARWYMNNGASLNGIDVASVIRAVPCRIKNAIQSLVTRGNGDFLYNVSGSFRDAIKTCFDGAVAQKGNLMSVLSTLSSYGMLTLLPTVDNFVITPRLDVSRWSKETGVYASRADVTGVSAVTSNMRLPIEAIQLNKRFGPAFHPSDGKNPVIQGVSDYGNAFRYPNKETTTGVLIVDPPAILAGTLDCSANIAMEGTPVLPMSQGGYGDIRNVAGATPPVILKSATRLLGEAAAQLMWSKFAFAHRSATLSLLPHWVFSEGFDDEVHAKYDTGVPWSLLGQELRFKMPYDTDDPSKKDVAYIGYVKGMTVTASTQTPALGVNVTLSNVRTEQEDQTVAPYLTANPLYDNIEAKPI